MNVNELRQRLETGIATIKSNWPPENYQMLREALTLAVELMEQALLQQPQPSDEAMGALVADLDALEQRIEAGEVCQHCGQDIGQHPQQVVPLEVLQEWVDALGGMEYRSGWKGKNGVRLTPTENSVERLKAAHNALKAAALAVLEGRPTDG